MADYADRICGERTAAMLENSFLMHSVRHRACSKLYHICTKLPPNRAKTGVI